MPWSQKATLDLPLLYNLILYIYRSVELYHSLSVDERGSGYYMVVVWNGINIHKSMEDPKQASQKDRKLDEVDRNLDAHHSKLKLIFDKY